MIAVIADLPLGINIWNLVAQIITFGIVLIVLAKWAFPALTKTLDQRSTFIREGVDNADKARRELKETETRVQAIMNDARQEAQATIARATQAAEHVRAEIEEEANGRARDILAQAEKRIQQEIAQARAQLRQEVADLAIQAAEHVTGSTLDTTTNRRLVDEFVAQSAQSRDVQC